MTSIHTLIPLPSNAVVCILMSPRGKHSESYPLPAHLQARVTAASGVPVIFKGGQRKSLPSSSWNLHSATEKKGRHRCAMGEI